MTHWIFAFFCSRIPCPGSPSHLPYYDLQWASKVDEVKEGNVSRWIHLNPVEGQLCLTEFGLKMARKKSKYIKPFFFMTYVI